MKFQLKRLFTVIVAVALIVGVGYFSWDSQLRASDEDGTVTAADTQEEAEQTLAPVEVVVPEETEEAVPADPFQNASIYIYKTNSDEIYYGDTVKLRAKVSGVEGNASYSIKWQTDDGMGGWKDIPGATGDAYSFTVDASNAKLPYRAVMICH